MIKQFFDIKSLGLHVEPIRQLIKKTRITIGGLTLLGSSIFIFDAAINKVLSMIV